MSYDVNCPYCDAEIEICHDDGFGMDQGEYHQYDCHECGAKFIFDTTISVDHTAYKADCLNDGNHDWQPQKTHPIEYTMMHCTMCEERRKPTLEELNLILK